MFSAIYATSYILGPGLGYLLGGTALTYYVDFERIPSDEIPDIPKTDPRWIGAYWIGFVAAAAFHILAMLIMPCLPNDPSVNFQQESVTAQEHEIMGEGKGSSSVKKGFFENFKGSIYCKCVCLLFLLYINV